MINKYQVEVIEFKEVHEMPDSWTNNDFLQVIKMIEYDDAEAIAEEELKDMCLMALSDLSVEEVADVLLLYRFGDKLSKGKRQNLVEELKEDRLWEEYSEIAFHEELFNISCLMYWTFPNKFPEPDIVKIVLKIKAMNSTALQNLKHMSASFLCRVLNDGMDEHNIIYRLFDEQLESNRFPESQDIIWKFDSLADSSDTDAFIITAYTSFNWVDELKGVKSYESSAYADVQ